MQYLALLTTLLPLLASTHPLTPRAGGPISKPIPSNCTITNPLPHSPCSGTTTYKPSSALTSAHLLYQAYSTSPLSLAAQANQCVEQCYGYGNIGECKAAFLAHDVPTPKGWEGTKGGTLETACLLFDTWLTEGDFVEAGVEGTWVDATAASIYCSS